MHHGKTGELHSGQAQDQSCCSTFTGRIAAVSLETALSIRPCSRRQRKTSGPIQKYSTRLPVLRPRGLTGACGKRRMCTMPGTSALLDVNWCRRRDAPAGQGRCTPPCRPGSRRRRPHHPPAHDWAGSAVGAQAGRAHTQRQRLCQTVK